MKTVEDQGFLTGLGRGKIVRHGLGCARRGHMLFKTMVQRGLTTHIFRKMKGDHLREHWG